MVLVWVVLWFLVTCGFWLWSARPIVLMWFLWVGGLALDAEADDCASSCSLWTDKKDLPIAPLRAMFRFVAIGGDLYKWRKRSWLERP